MIYIIREVLVLLNKNHLNYLKDNILFLNVLFSNAFFKNYDRLFFYIFFITYNNGKFKFCKRKHN